jgi:acid phosphatase
VRDIVCKLLFELYPLFLRASSFEGPQVRLLLNGATYPLTICEDSDEDVEYGTCSLAAFVEANKWSMEVEYNSDFWNTTCGHHQ